MDSTTDITKMKVADLKNELKLRNLSTTGKRPELLERLQQAIASGVERENEEELDEEHLLAGDEEDDEVAPMEEEATPAPKPTPARASRRSIAAVTSTPKTPARRVALKRTPAAELKVPEIEEEEPKAITPAKTPVKTPAKEPAEGAPPAKVAKVDTPKADTKPAEVSEANKENGEPQEKTALEKRSERFGVVSDQSAKSKRAERFGIVSDDSAKAKRAERFGVITKEEKQLKRAKMTQEPVEVEKIKARAARFGTSTSSALDAEKKQSRAERFGEKTVANGSSKDVTSDEAKAARAAKFATTETAETAESEEPMVSKSGKTLITFGTEDSAKLKRAARFAGAN